MHCIYFASKAQLIYILAANNCNSAFDLLVKKCIYYTYFYYVYKKFNTSAFLPFFNIAITICNIFAKQMRTSSKKNIACARFNTTNTAF